MFLFTIFLLLPFTTPILVPLVIRNQCPDTIWPAISTQAGKGPSIGGFQLSAGSTQNLSVDTSWNGRVWGRTNCTFDSRGRGTCGTGDCGGNLNCVSSGASATLAEFNLPAFKNSSFYDISLVDGYNLPIAIVALLGDHPDNPPSNTTNPSCVGSAQDLAPVPFNPYNTSADFLGTSASDPLPFDTKITPKQVNSWCPSDSSSIKRPKAKKNSLNIRKYNSAKKCGPNYYSKQAKRVCPDAYSYAYDDGSSTFSVPTGAGFEIVFCPGGRSTTIQMALGMASTAIKGVEVKMLSVVVAVVVGMWLAAW